MTLDDIKQKLTQFRTMLMTGDQVPHPMAVCTALEIIALERELENSTVLSDHCRDLDVLGRAAVALGCTTLNVDEVAELAQYRINELESVITEGERVFRKQSSAEEEVKWLSWAREVLKKEETA